MQPNRMVPPTLIFRGGAVSGSSFVASLPISFAVLAGGAATLAFRSVGKVIFCASAFSTFFGFEGSPGTIRET